jgi:hypothetical protein
MTYQTNANVLVAISREVTEGTAATATGAMQLRIVDSPGLKLDRGQIQSQEKRDDGDKSMGRLGNKSVGGSFNVELSAGGAIDSLLEAIMRSTWSAAAPTTFTSMTTVAVGTNTLTAAAGDWVAQGIKAGDIVTLSGTGTAANHDLRTQVRSVTTLVVTVASSSYTTATASASGTVTRLKKVVSATTPTKYSYTVEQVDQDVDGSEYFTGCALVGCRLSFRPNQHATATFTFAGINRTTVTGGSSPYFTSPSITTNLPLVADDSVITFNGSTVADFTGLDLDIQIAGRGEAVIGSLVTPSIFMNDRMVSGTITGLRSDFSKLTLFDAETEFAIHLTLLELESAPKSCLAFYIPRVKIVGIDAPLGGGDGAKVETLQLMIAPKDAATGVDGTILNISSSE